MTQKEIEQQNTAVLITLHKEWLNHSQTKALNAALDRHKSTIERALCAASMDRDVSSEHVRLLAAQLSTLHTIKNLINATTTFIAKCSASTEA